MLTTCIACIVAIPVTPNERILKSAAIQAKQSALYDASYARLSYPGGDIPLSRGCCADVTIRALRAAGYDLQKLIYEDAGNNPRAYPGIGIRDKNIDHRRVRNQVVYFKRFGALLRHHKPLEFRPGDFVFWKLDSGRDHIGIVTSTRGESGCYRVVHNLSVCKEEDCLTRYKIVGRFKFPKV